MVTYKAKIYNVEQDDIVGAEITIYSDEGDKIDTINIVSNDDLINLKNKVDDIEAAGIDINKLITALNEINIDATTLDGESKTSFATAEHTHGDTYAPKNHSNADTIYGVGTNSQYGHVKVVDNLSTGTFNANAPVVLSAKQGNVLNTEVNKKVNKTDVINNLNSSLTQQPLSANQGRILNNNLSNARSVADSANSKVNQLLNSNWSNAQRLNLSNDYVGTDCFMMVRNGYVTITFSATANVPGGMEFTNPLTPFTVNNYKPLMNVKNGMKIGVPGVGEIAATIEIDTAGVCRIFSGRSSYPNGTGVYGMIVYPYAGY